MGGGVISLAFSPWASRRLLSLACDLAQQRHQPVQNINLALFAAKASPDGNPEDDPDGEPFLVAVCSWPNCPRARSISPRTKGLQGACQINFFPRRADRLPSSADPPKSCA